MAISYDESATVTPSTSFPRHTHPALRSWRTNPWNSCPPDHTVCSFANFTYSYWLYHYGDANPKHSIRYHTGSFGFIRGGPSWKQAGKHELKLSESPPHLNQLAGIALSIGDTHSPLASASGFVGSGENGSIPKTEHLQTEYINNISHLWIRHVARSCCGSHMRPCVSEGL